MSPRTRREKRQERRRWLRKEFWPQKRREFRCWLRFGHENIVLGGAAGWVITSCQECGAERVGPLNFLNGQWTQLESAQKAGSQR